MNQQAITIEIFGGPAILQIALIIGLPLYLIAFKLDAVIRLLRKIKALEEKGGVS